MNGQRPFTHGGPTGSRLHINIGAARPAPRSSEDVMRKNMYIDQELERDDAAAAADDPAPATGGLPNRLLTAFEVAEYIGCHEETVRRAYLRGLLNST